MVCGGTWKSVSAGWILETYTKGVRRYQEQKGLLPSLTGIVCTLAMDVCPSNWLIFEIASHYMILSGLKITISHFSYPSAEIMDVHLPLKVPQNILLFCVSFSSFQVKWTKNLLLSDTLISVKTKRQIKIIHFKERKFWNLEKRTNKQNGYEKKNRNLNSLSLSALQCKHWKQKLHSNYNLKNQNGKPTTLSAVLPRE